MLSQVAYTTNYKDYALGSSLPRRPYRRRASDVPYTLGDNHDIFRRNAILFELVISQNSGEPHDCVYHTLLRNLRRRIDGTDTR